MSLLYGGKLVHSSRMHLVKLFLFARTTAQIAAEAFEISICVMLFSIILLRCASEFNQHTDVLKASQPIGKCVGPSFAASKVVICNSGGV